jgi:hypothetical protein
VSVEDPVGFLREWEAGSLGTEEKPYDPKTCKLYILVSFITEPVNAVNAFGIEGRSDGKTQTRRGVDKT